MDRRLPLIASVIALGPILWALSTSLKSNNRIFSVPPQLIPSQPSLEHYQRLIAEGRQVYVVCPLIDVSDKLEVASAEEMFPGAAESAPAPDAAGEGGDHGRPRSVIDPNGNTTTFEYYDASRDGRLKRLLLFRW